jgi:hypothetical protein
MDWQPISTYPVPRFDPLNWYISTENVLVWDSFPRIAQFGYTKTGKGRWHDPMGIVYPTHWMPLPPAPAENP